ncbi:hypothetical protein [Arenimonas sp. MALMAid1274]|uniref:hypothetical protein n=1 Tax=Arenimonas sp. MALMAid1274 TaxID=3411630 RepID=UPI003B9FE502
MSFVAIGLFVLACGWNVYRLFLPTRSSAMRAEGHPQYFGAALMAGYVGFLAIFLHAAALKHDGYESAMHSLAQLAPKASDDDKAASQGGKGAQEGQDNSPARPQPAETASLVVHGNVIFSSSEPSPAATAVATAHPVRPDGDKSAPERSYQTALGVGLWSAFLAFVLPLLLNAPFFRNARLRFLAGRKNFNEIEEAAVDALARKSSLLITLNTGKVYVGFPSEFDPTGDESDWLRIWPIASGYRTRKGNLRLTTSYEDAYAEIFSSDGSLISVNDFEVLLPLTGIASVQRFKLRFYLDHFAAEGSSREDDDFLEALISEGMLKPTHVLTGEQLVAISDVPSPGQPARPSQPPSSANASKPAQTSPVGAPVDPWAKQVPDFWLRSLKWGYHLCLTAAVVSLPFESWPTSVFVLAGFLALTLTVEPADEALTDFVAAIRDYGHGR